MIMGVQGRPVGVKVLSIFFFVCSLFLIALSVLVIIKLSAIAVIVPILGTGSGIVLFLLGILFLVMGVGLWKMKNWARLLVAAFCLISLLGAIWSVFIDGRLLSIPNLVIFGLIIYYLLFSKKIRENFKNV